MEVRMNPNQSSFTHMEDAQTDRSASVVAMLEDNISTLTCVGGMCEA